MVRRLKLLLKILLVFLILTVAFMAHKYDWLEKTVLWIESYGAWGPTVFFGIYVLTCILFVPSIFFSFASGILFGFLKGTSLSILGLAVGSTVAFLIGRYIAREKITDYFEHNKKFQLIDHAIHKKGWKVILLARLTPIFPFLIANYGFGLTKLKARHYFIASLIGSIPSTAVYAYAGSLTGELTSTELVTHSRTPAEWTLLIMGLFVTVLLGWYLKRLASKALQEDLT